MILTDQLINKISKPEKFFNLLSNNLIVFWRLEKERMFIKLLLDKGNLKNIDSDYSLKIYLDDFRKLTTFIFQEMIKHKFIRKNSPDVLSNEFINPLFLAEIENLLTDDIPDRKFVNEHVGYFWDSVKRK